MADRTQQQSTEDQQRSKDLSRKKERPPIEIPGYAIRKFLGAGAYGEVWVAVDENTGRRVAIKFYLHRGGVDWSLLSSEVEKLVFLSADRYVVQLLDVGWDSEPPYYVMEYIENGSLEDYLQKDGPLPVGEAVELFREIANGLMHAHGKGILHCDLKPANILLDLDNKPRLADFGQSRLSHEQTPALGTLFYMAPEQASLKAVPDARWDVYALGALLYSMLVGEAPHRSEDAVSEIDTADELETRLERYREFINKSAPLSAHRSIHGIDRSLIEIIDRCLHIDPHQRYDSVHRVIDALSARDERRDRHPLLILGLLGPLLFSLVAVLSGWRGYSQAIKESEQLLISRAVQENRYAASFVAEAVARRIERYFSLVEEAADGPSIRGLVKDLTRQHPATSEILNQLSRRDLEPNVQAQLREQFINDDRYRLLQELIDERMKNNSVGIASWFISDEKGTQIASVFDSAIDDTTVGKNFAWRSYFSGTTNDLPRDSDPRNRPHINSTHLSAVFQSQATNAWKVAVSTPIRDEDGEFLGIVALTIELGELNGTLTSESESRDDETANDENRQFNVLVDGRDNKGVILQHPLFVSLLDQEGALPDAFSEEAEFRVPLANWKEDAYHDPLGKHPTGVKYQDEYIAAKRNVFLDRRERRSSLPNENNSTNENFDTGLVVLVQENYSSAAAVIHDLASNLLWLGSIALSVLVAIVLLLWYLVVRAMRDPNERIRRGGGMRQPLTSLKSMETVELPAHLRRGV